MQRESVVQGELGTDNMVHDLPRVMRLPGFDHQKEAPTRVAIIDAAPTLPDYTASDFWGAFGGVAKLVEI